MGWSSIPVGEKLSSREVRETLLREFTWKNDSHKVIDIGSSGSDYYLAIEEQSTKNVFAAVVLTIQKDGWLSYKPMDEFMGPYSYGCPKRILQKLTPTDNKFANTWREKCWRKFNTPKPKVGDIIRFETPIEFTDGVVLDTFELVKYNRRILFETKDGLYRIPKWREREFSIIERGIGNAS